MKIREIMVVEDDADDRETFDIVFNALNVKRPVKYFVSAQDALNYLNVQFEKPFLILSDINMPGLNGFEFKKEINNTEKHDLKNVPFVFITNADPHTTQNTAKILYVDGIFQKPNSIDKFKNMLQRILDYWELNATLN